MATFLYDQLLSTDGGNPTPGAVGSFYDESDIDHKTPLVWYDTAGVAKGTVATFNSKGLFPPYRLDRLNAQFKSGAQPAIPVVSFEGLKLEVQAAQSSASASKTAAAASATAAANAAGLVNAPSDAVVNAVLTNPDTAASRALSATYARRKAYNVRDYMGADDIGAAVNRAILAASQDARGFGTLGGQVILPQGNFAQTTPILPRSGVDIIGQGWGRSVLRPQGEVTSIRRNREQDGATTLNYIRDVTFENFEIDGSEQKDLGNGVLIKGTYLIYQYRMTYRGLYVHDTGFTAMGNDAMCEVLYEDCITSGAGRIGGRNGAGCSGFGFGTSGKWYQAPFPPIHDYSLKVDNCVGRDNARFGMFFETQVAGDRQKDVQVTNFSASGNGQAGLSDSGCDGLQVINANLHHNTEAGFTVDAGTFPIAPTPGINGTLINMKVNNNGTDGIVLDGSETAGGTGYRLLDSDVKENGGHGVRIKAGDVTKPVNQITIRGNNIFSSQKHGVYVTSAGGEIADMQVTDNRLMNNGKSGTTFHGFRADPTLVRPHFRGNTAHNIAGNTTQQYGFSFGSSVAAGTFDGNFTKGSANAAIGISGASSFDAESNVGFNIGYTVKAGSPNGVVSAPVGTLYRRTDGTVGTTLYVKESAAVSSSEGWTPMKAAV